MISCDKKSLQEKITTFSQFGDTGNGGITRLTLTKEDILARDEFCNRCQKLGMTIETDDMGIIYATLPGKEDLPAISLGSHLDSVVRGGNFDGVLGVLTALEVVETIVHNDIHMKHPIKIIDFTNEEGARFEPSMMTSGVVTGKFDEATILATTDLSGETFGAALEKSGYKGDKANRLKDIGSYLELHIEQGPVLETQEKQIGVVEGVVGMVCYEITVSGEADHAGTTPMNMRKDALFTVTDIIRNLRETFDTFDESLVYTMGRMTVEPNIHTVIPDKVVFTVEARHQDPSQVKKVAEVIEKLPEVISGCSVASKLLWARDTVPFNQTLVDCVELSCQNLELSYKKMYSGAGHDAQFMATILPATMIFVPSINGKSHTEIEKTHLEDCLNGANVLLQTVLHYDKKID